MWRIYISANSMLTGQPAKTEQKTRDREGKNENPEKNRVGMERPRKRPKQRIIAMVRYNRITCIVLRNNNERSKRKEQIPWERHLCAVCVLAWRLGYLFACLPACSLDCCWYTTLSGLCVYITNRRAKNVALLLLPHITHVKQTNRT